MKVTGITEDLLGDAEPTLRQILAPVHEHARALPESDAELAALFDNARTEVYETRGESRGDRPMPEA